MEVFKFILTNYGPVVCAVCLMVYLCFFMKKSINGNEKNLKDSIVSLLRENASLKKELVEQKKLMNDTVKKLNEKIEELDEQLETIIEGSEENVGNNKDSEA